MFMISACLMLGLSAFTGRNSARKSHDTSQIARVTHAGLVGWKVDGNAGREMSQEAGVGAGAP